MHRNEYNESGGRTPISQIFLCKTRWAWTAKSKDSASPAVAGGGSPRPMGHSATFSSRSAAKRPVNLEQIGDAKPQEFRFRRETHTYGRCVCPDSLFSRPDGGPICAMWLQNDSCA